MTVKFICYYHNKIIQAEEVIKHRKTTNCKYRNQETLISVLEFHSEVCLNLSLFENYTQKLRLKNYETSGQCTPKVNTL